MFPGVPAPGVSLAVDYTGDGTIDWHDAIVARQIMARHLYVLAMMLIDQNLLNNPTNGPVYNVDGPSRSAAEPQQLPATVRVGPMGDQLR